MCVFVAVCVGGGCVYVWQGDVSVMLVTDV